MAESDPHLSAESLMAADPAPRKSRARGLALMLSVPVLVIGGAAYWYVANDHYVSTDNAYVHQDKVSVSAEVGGRIVEVRARENQPVKAGDLLFRIDPEPFRIAEEQATAAIAAAQVEVGAMQADLNGAQAEIDAARDAVRFYELASRRQSDLMATGFTTRAALEKAQNDLAQARGRLADGLATQAKRRADLATGAAAPGVNPAVLAGEAQRHQALLNLRRTEVRAPVGGIVSQADRLQIGQMLPQSLPALSIVMDGRSWIEANFKETDLKAMHVGQPVEIKVDAYPGMPLTGHVASIGAGTGSEFAVLPAQNANGNWVKVTQRVPVRIAIDGRPDRSLIAGLSTHVRIDTSR
ncbi:HlyD family secretion protein [Sphingobium sufflavum]|uniref:HlyD family secretion protein n=1 Tax=Sphingobium sufflavum TaxID=1129547 RepID=UPI001F22CEFA|nr:HlyD family secretion protein [Sphingobium sufflavum]MCE7796901.1 HlyD family secretion protein [Sphingobium sufflavum]